MVERRADSSDEMGHEPTTVGARAVLLAVVVLFGGIFAALVLMAGLSKFLAAVWGGAPSVDAAGTAIALPAGVPSVDANQTITLQQLRARETKVLSEYAWLDREQGIARIPIQRAMEILSQHPARTPELPNDEMAGR